MNTCHVPGKHCLALSATLTPVNAFTPFYREENEGPREVELGHTCWDLNPALLNSSIHGPASRVSLFSPLPKSDSEDLSRGLFPSPSPGSSVLSGPWLYKLGASLTGG